MLSLIRRIQQGVADMFFAGLLLMLIAVFGDIFDERDDPRGD